MKHCRSFCALILFLLLCAPIIAQKEESLPRYLTDSEVALLPHYRPAPGLAEGSSEPPPGPVRTMAEWEELQALVITWRSYFPILTEIVRAAQQECRVIITCPNQSVADNARSYLSNRGIQLDSNIVFLIAPSNSVWVRDYGPNPAYVYIDQADSLCLIDWIYNRPRPSDDTLPRHIARYLGLPLYSTTTAPDDLVHTGGNFMADGLGTGFSSELILDENRPGNAFGVSAKDEADIDGIMSRYHGLHRYAKMETLPFDGIHHIDMHMKLLDEETLLVGQYPEGIADGPQIEANLQYVLSHFKTWFGTPFKVVRIPMPPHNGRYPDQGGHYRTYTNAVFVNKTVIVPFYEERYDTTAQSIWEEALPGYRIVGINCNDMIAALGAIHCITKEIGVLDPLRILHQPLSHVNDQWPGYPVWAAVYHRSGIASVNVCHATDPEGPWTCTPMPEYLPDDTIWTHRGVIPRYPAGTTVYYYIEATANNGKRMTRPMPAPNGYWKFVVEPTVALRPEPESTQLLPIYPNPASAITVVPLQLLQTTALEVSVCNALGQTVQVLFAGELPAGQQQLFLQADALPAGTYWITVRTPQQVLSQKLLVR